MKLLLIICSMACITLHVYASVEEELSIIEAQTTSPMTDGDVTEIVLAGEPIVKEVSLKIAPTTTAPKPVAVVDAPVAQNKTRKSSNRSRTSNTRRKQPAKAKTVTQEPVSVSEDENQKTETTSPASVDTAFVSAQAPKDFKPTPMPLDDFQQSQGLVEFLKKRKLERFQATTTQDPIVAILATATAPATEAPPTPAPASESVIPSRRLPSTGRRFGANARTTVTTTTTTTSAPSTEATTVAAVTSRRSNSNRFSVLRNKSSTTLSTTTALPVTEEPKSTADSSARSKLFPKRPVNFRPVGNSISRRKDQVSSTEAPTTKPAVAADAEVASIQEEVVEVIAEPTTVATLRRTRGRLAPRVTAI